MGSPSVVPDPPARMRVDVPGGRRVQAGDGTVQYNYSDYRTVVSAGPVVRSAYRYQVESIVPPELVGRETELAELADFCTAQDRGPCVWWRAPAWAGKSALMAWFALNPPPEVRAVSFFITARWAGQDNRVAFTNVLLEQLAELLGGRLQGWTAESADPHRRTRASPVMRYQHHPPAVPVRVRPGGAR